MKLNLLFIVIDVMILLAYPFVYVHGRLRLFSKAGDNIALVPVSTISVVVPATEK
ncbi:MAG: hypothetical protein QY332_05900 [Anaerolineales bacterium]|nr:MAG: hypothetical protein QY332_05900 [Anaerolineales bacterium]